MRLSIRWRLSLWNTAALAVVLTAFAAMIYYVLAREHFERIDRRIHGAFQELADDPGRLTNPEALAAWVADAKEDDNISCVVYGPGGAVLARTQDLPEGDIPAVPAATDEAALR